MDNRCTEGKRCAKGTRGSRVAQHLVIRSAAASPAVRGLPCPAPRPLAQGWARGTAPPRRGRAGLHSRAHLPSPPSCWWSPAPLRPDPPQGGLIFWADLVGAPRIVARLRHFASLVGPRHAGFFAPCDYLVAAAEAGRKLGAGPGAAAKL